MTISVRLAGGPLAGPILDGPQDDHLQEVGALDAAALTECDDDRDRLGREPDSRAGENDVLLEAARQAATGLAQLLRFRGD